MSDFDFSKHLKELRKSKGMTAKSVHISSGIPYSTYMKYEQGQFMPTIPAIKAIAQALHCTTDELLGYSLDNNEYERVKAELAKLGIKVTEDSGGFIHVEYPDKEDYSHRLGTVLDGRNILVELVAIAQNRTLQESLRLLKKNIYFELARYSYNYASLIRIILSECFEDSPIYLSATEKESIVQRIQGTLPNDRVPNIIELAEKSRKIFREYIEAHTSTAPDEVPALTDTQKNSPAQEDRA